VSAPIELPLWKAADLLYPGAALTKIARKLKPMTIGGKLPYWAVLTILAALGFVCIINPAWKEWQWDHGVINEIGIALLISAVLGATDRTKIAEYNQHSDKNCAAAFI
jgi:hypothetical protein